ncbi:histidine phosphatase family protein [Lederbergia lenta]|uniref:histidine phosphatase family protein n=1 Tax=Lederbergia lenta TaxID=1467 RepID=UPI002040383F|nr:histidine phosphatase family protein [Lederbergia lenta]MCM3109606.1 histidine phosphatase family protein [Lederbergia lenta]
MEITLIRHGRSTLTINNRINIEGFKNWIEDYDRNGVFEERSYPSETLEKIATTNVVISSDLKRAIESAKFLKPHTKTISKPLFRETELPIPLTNVMIIKLHPQIWAVIFRCLWFFGYSKQCESFGKAKQRAKTAAEQLVAYAKEYNSVALIGHGFFNLLIAKELQKMGWKGKRKTGSTHWNATSYSFSANE